LSDWQTSFLKGKQLSADLRKAYELLGVKPGVSNRELKAAHRDLAKVWHPDRFLHDPRLQEKAQEKLKEINEAYELLISGKIPRATPQTAYAAVEKPARAGRTGGSKWAVIPVFVFVVVFAITTKILLQQRAHRVQELEAQTESAPIEQEQSQSNTRRDATVKVNRDASVPEVNSSSTEVPPSEPTAALATVSVTIDPESGLLAKSDCPVRSRMTYPRGSEPSAYCNITHTPPPKESRIKSIAEKILPQRRKGAAEKIEANQ
jgi:DnaJ-like protein